MELIKTWEFRINKNTDDSSQKSPDLPLILSIKTYKLQSMMIAITLFNLELMWAVI